MADKKFTKPKLYPTNRDLSKTWLVAFRYDDPDTGQRKQFQFRDNLNELPTAKERLARAKVLMESFSDLLQDGWNPFNKEMETVNPEANLPLSTLLIHILEVKKSTWTPKTRQTYSDHRKQLAKWLEARKYAGLLPKFFDRQKAQEYMDYCLAQRKYAGKTFNGHLSTLRTFFNEMLTRNLIKENPFNGIKKLPETRNENVSFTRDERLKVREHLKQHNTRLYYAVQFVYYCFLRRTELISLRVGDVDLDRKTIRVAGKIAKSRRSESITIPKSFEVILLEMNLDKLPKDHYIFGKSFETSPTLLPKTDYFTDAHRNELKNLGIRADCTFYSWKHTGVMELYRATKDIYVVMKQCRHTDISTTMIYLRSLGLIVDEVVRNADFEF